MNNTNQQPNWWELHLRKARGEQLSEEEQRVYDAEMARHDQEPPLRGDIETLKAMRTSLSALKKQSADLRARIEQLEQEVQRREQSLSSETRELLGIKE